MRIIMNVKKVTVIGANGIMGRNISAIFASFGKAKVYMICRDIEKAELAVEKACNSIKSESIRDRLIPKTYEDLKNCVVDSDLIFESLSENYEVKKNMYKKIVKFMNDTTIIATGTSSLSITKLAEIFGNKANNFFGVHMFNPPYNLQLCELIIHSDKQRENVEIMKEYLEKNLYRKVVIIKDSPAFLANRIGFFFISECLKLADKYQSYGGIDYIDSIFGPFTGRIMPPLETVDFVGIDTTKSIIDYVYENSISNDIFSASFKTPEYLNKLFLDGCFGEKTGQGLYKREDDVIYVWDILNKKYREKKAYNLGFSSKMIAAIKYGNYEQAYQILIGDQSDEAIICKTLLLKYVIYSIKISSEISDSANSCDIAMANGFNWIPPMGVISLFGGWEKFLEIATEVLDSKYSNIITNIANKVDLKKYTSLIDYRSFLRAK